MSYRLATKPTFHVICFSYQTHGHVSSPAFFFTFPVPVSAAKDDAGSGVHTTKQVYKQSKLNIFMFQNVPNL